MKQGQRFLLLGALGLFGVLVVVLAVGVVATWAPDRPVAELAPRWAQAPSRFVAVQGLNIHLRDEGPRNDPHPIVLLHGTADSLHTWEGWAQALRGERRVLRFDLPGFGLTGPHPHDDYSMAAYTRVVLGVLDALGIQQPVVLAGNSLGGQIAWETALAAPARVATLVLVDAAGYAFASESVPIGFRIARLPVLRDLVRHVLPRGVVERSVRNVVGDPSRVTPTWVDRFYELALREGNRRALAMRMDRRFTALDSGRITQIRQPTLILWGGRDRLIPLAWGQRFARDIPGAQLVVFDDLGHVPQEEDPSQTVAAFRRFLAPAR